MEFPSLSLKSKADLNHIDNQGHSVVHYLVPLDSKEELIGDGDDGIGDIKFPSYDNHILLLQLHSLGAKINVPNGKGQTLKERACKAGCQKLLLAMKHLESRGDTIGVDEVNMVVMIIKRIANSVCTFSEGHFPLSHRVRQYWLVTLRRSCEPQ